jgi:hypothetical protein
VNDLINNGKVEKSMFYNKSQAEIFLSEASKKEKKTTKLQIVLSESNKGPFF